MSAPNREEFTDTIQKILQNNSVLVCSHYGRDYWIRGLTGREVLRLTKVFRRAKFFRIGEACTHQSLFQKLRSKCRQNDLESRMDSMLCLTYIGPDIK